MLSKNAKRALNLAKTKENLSISFSDISRELGINNAEARIAGEQLAAKRLVTIYKNFTFQGHTVPHGIRLTEEGIHRKIHLFESLSLFLLKSVIVPVIVAFLTTLITLLLQNLFVVK